MGLFEVFMIAIALAMDAFGVSLGIGINKISGLDISISKYKKLENRCILSFGFFQFLLAFLGGMLGAYLNNNIIHIPNKLVAVVIAVVGILMIRDGKSKNESYNILKKGMVTIVGISVSIDAFVVGFSTFSGLNSIILIMVYSILIGLVTSFLCAVSFAISRYIAKINIISKYSNYIGGMILIIIAIKTAFYF